MTTCPKCGYASEGAECPACGVIFAKLAARAEARPQRPAMPEAPGSGAESQPFNALFVSALTPDRQYRVYCRPGLIYLIRFGGQPVNLGSIVARQLGGVVGEALYSGFSNKDAARDKKTSELDRQDPEALLPGHKHNLRISLAEVDRSLLEAPPLFGGHGEHVGRWTLELRGGKSMIFQLPSPLDGETAEPQLTALLGARLLRKARWSPAEGVFVKT